MFVCLSSGARPRYRRDVLRALAGPKGTLLQFRYDEQWIADDVKALVKSGQVSGVECLIAYIDQTRTDVPPSVIPVRSASMVRADAQGRFFVLVMELSDYASAEGQGIVDSQLAVVAAGNMPHWNDEQIEGKYWFQCPQMPQAVKVGEDLRIWQSAVDRLAQRKEFDAETLFYAVLGIFPAGSDSAALPANGVFALEPETDYELRLHHYRPREPHVDGEDKVPVLEVSQVGEGVSFASYPILAFDSRYDQKAFRFKTKASGTGSLALLRRGSECEQDPDIELSLAIGQKTAVGS